MKKILSIICILTSMTLFASAHCGSCKKGDEKHEAKKKECTKKTCSKKKSAKKVCKAQIKAGLDAKLNASFAKHDADKDGKITSDEFKAIIAEWRNECEIITECKKKE